MCRRRASVRWSSWHRSAILPTSLWESSIVTPDAERPAPLVLVVDDDQEVARLLEESIRPAFNTRSVTTGRAALDVVAREDIGVILADQRMPDMEGLELL